MKKNVITPNSFQDEHSPPSFVSLPEKDIAGDSKGYPTHWERLPNLLAKVS